MGLGQNVEMPWLCLGDFNDLLRPDEKQGGGEMLSSTSRGLMSFMTSMNFVDIGFVGSKYTWCNKRPGLANIQERLGRGISNIPWRVAYENAIIHHYPLTNSDHVPLVLPLYGMECSVPKAFKFKIFWIRDVSCMGVVAAAWSQRRGKSLALLLFQKIRDTWFALRKWNKLKFGNIKQSLRLVKD